MSRIFRSDAVSVGERVVARRDFGGVHSDVIGHVVSVDPLVIRPQEVGGYPSSLEAVEIPPEQLKIIKRLSPRTVRNSCLLYTSPSPRDATLSRMPSSA